MARKAETDVSLAPELQKLFADIYADAKTEGERKILDIVLSYEISKIFKEQLGSIELPPEKIAKIMGVSTSGVKVILGRTFGYLKKQFNKSGIRSTDDVLNTSSGRQFANVMEKDDEADDED